MYLVVGVGSVDIRATDIAARDSIHRGVFVAGERFRAVLDRLNQYTEGERKERHLRYTVR